MNPHEVPRVLVDEHMPRIDTKTRCSAGASKWVCVYRKSTVYVGIENRK